MKLQLRGLVVFFLIFTGITLAFQYHGGAWHADFSGHPDEPAHYVTGLLLHDYLRNGIGENPMRYAENFYLHYPKVAIGHWPPVFYALQAGWEFAFGESRLALMVLMAILTALLTTVVYREARAHFPWWMAALLAVLFLFIPIINLHSRMVMIEIPLALLVLCAVISYARYLDSDGKWKWMMWFTLWSVAALLTKGVAGILVLTPSLAVLFSGRFRILRRWSFWMPALLVAVPVLPWYLAAPGALHTAVAPTLEDLFRFRWWQAGAIRYDFAHMFGGVLISLVLLGIFDRVVLPMWQRRPRGGIWAVSLAVAVAMVIFRFCVTPASHYRHLIAVVAPMMLFAPAGVVFAGRLWPLAALPEWTRRTLLVAGAAALATTFYIVVPTVPNYGYSALARQLIATEELDGRCVMISSDPVGEGAFVAEMAQREVRPGRYIVRASKVLAHSNWLGYAYKLRYDGTQAVREVLDELSVGILVLDSDAGEHTQHHRQLQQLVMEDKDRWRQLYTSAGEDISGQVKTRTQRLYVRVGAEPDSGAKGEIGERLRKLIGKIEER